MYIRQIVDNNLMPLGKCIVDLSGRLTRVFMYLIHRWSSIQNLHVIFSYPCSEQAANERISPGILCVKDRIFDEASINEHV